MDINKKSGCEIVGCSDYKEGLCHYDNDECKYSEAFSSESDLLGGFASDFSQMRQIAAHIHYPECWDTMAYPTLASAVCEITKCDPEHCIHNDNHHPERV